MSLRGGGHIDKSLRDRIDREHFVHTPLRPADLLFVFGTRHGVCEFAKRAHKLWEEGLFEWAIVSGGATLGEEEAEADVLRREMIARGVPEEIILVEDRAMNTGENVEFSLRLLDATLGRASVNSVIALGKFYAGRRYLMTLERHWPRVEKMFVGVNWCDVPDAEWHMDAFLRERVVREFNKIDDYLARGFLAPWPSTQP